MSPGSFLLRRRRWVAGLLAALIGLIAQPRPEDLLAFADLGRKVLAGRLDEVYAGAFTQAGPLQLVLSRWLLIGGEAAMPAAVVRIVVDVALTLGAMAACRGRPVRECVVAVLALLWLLGPTPWAGHPVEVAIPILWCCAMVLQRDGRWVVAATLLGASVLIAPIAVLGFPCLLAVAGPVRAARTALMAAGIALSGFLPFVVSGEFGMFGHVWPVNPGTLPYLLGLRAATWTARLMQAVVVSGGCALAAVLLRGRPVAVAAAPLVAALLRLATDPIMFDYYWLPASVGSVLLVALLPDDLRPAWQVSAVVLGYLTMLAATTDQGAIGAAAMLAGYLALAVSVRPRRATYV
ncbi:hypothetical protein Q0Z83_050500 [Actinoplanes sichuanensis]|uniref:DUF2029 domain-containing protein n=1 Tax=Actinoplanes sichuanensis TaxID=512349 RepID=A0ABW4AMR8_9ACTN|nr:hypothetical protein [Actinoplanes sichuanensis]BEL06859.1 hypothetical protein Q0Z83_050500 [Actinoplanes sichuanensis]